MKLSNWLAAGAASSFAIAGSGALAQTFHFGEGQSSLSKGKVSHASHSASPPKHESRTKARQTSIQHDGKTSGNEPDSRARP